jgi:hypothetical protein
MMLIVQEIGPWEATWSAESSGFGRATIFA